MKKLSFILISIILCVCLTSCSVFGIVQKVTLPYSPSADSLKDHDMPSADLPNPPTPMDFGISDTFDPEGALSKMYAYDYQNGFVTVATNIKNGAFVTNSGLFIDSSVYDRNNAIKSGLNLTFSTLVEKDAAAVVKNLESANKNMTKYADVIAVSLSDVSLFDGKTVFCEASSLPFVNASGYAINNETFSLESSTFVISEASILPSQTKIVYFNSSLMKNASIGKADPYTLLSGNKWTWDALENYISKTYPLMTADDLSSLINATVSEASEENTAKAKSIADKIAESTEKSDDPRKDFLDGKALFYIGTLADISAISESEIDFGLLPVPVFEEGDPYLDLHNASDITVYAVPGGANDIERAAFILSAISECSAGSRANAFSQILESRMLTTNGARVALGYIFTATMKAVY